MEGCEDAGRAGLVWARMIPYGHMMGTGLLLHTYDFILLNFSSEAGKVSLWNSNVQMDLSLKLISNLN